MLNGFYTSIHRQFNSLLYRGYDADGARVYSRYKFRPTLYVESKDNSGTWSSLDGKRLSPVRFDSMSEAREFSKTYADVQGFNVYGNDRHIVSFVQAELPAKINYSADLIDVAYIDIETDYGVIEGVTATSFPEPDEAYHEVRAISLRSSKKNSYIVWGRKKYDTRAALLKDVPIEYREFASEAELLDDFVSWWSEPSNTPDLISGWNIRIFDIPYLINRISRVHGSDFAKRLSPWGIIEQNSVMIKGKENNMYDIAGVPQLDYLDIFKKFTANTYKAQESYRLDYIAGVVLGDSKLNYEDVGSLNALYESDYQRYIDYNIYDTELVYKFEQKLGLLGLVYSLAYFGGVNYNDTLGTVAIWDAIIFRYLAERKIAIPPHKHSRKEEYPGGYVKEVHPGFYKWIMSFDLNSLYPSLIIQYNMSPETVCHDKKRHDISVDTFLKDPESCRATPGYATAANGACFSKTKQGFLPQIIEELYSRRVGVKSEMLSEKRKLDGNTTLSQTERSAVETHIARLETEQMCIKILMNSLYGAIGNRFFRYYDLNIAEGITLTGQLAVRWAERAVNVYLNKVTGIDKDRLIAIDTDGIYVDMADVISKFNPKDPVAFLNEFGGERGIERTLKNAYASLAEYSGAYKNTLVMKREVIADIGLWTAKKRYILHVHDSEGVAYSTPQLKMMGIEAVKSSTPKICRDAFKQLFKTLMTGTESAMQQEIATFKAAFFALPPEQIAMPRGVNGLQKWRSAASIYKSGTPKHVRAALMYNHMISRLNLQNKYQPIQSGDKIRFIDLKMPNPTGENVIGFVDKLPPEFGLDSYVNYEAQYQKTFLEPIILVLDAASWSPTRRSTLDDFFA